jgi:predicted PurR-regulated permease PerM
MNKYTSQSIIKGTLVILGVVILFLFVYHFLREFILVFMGIVLSISIAPAVDFLHKRKLNRSLSVLLIYLVTLSLLLGFVFLIIPQIAQQVSSLSPKFADLYIGVKTFFQNSPYSFIRQLTRNLPQDINSFFVSKAPALGQTNPLDSINLTIGIIENILLGLFKISVVLLIGFYWTLEGERALYAFSLLLPVEKRESSRALIGDIESRVGGFVRGQGLLALVIGLMVLIAYSVIGLPSVLSLAVLAGICELIPVFGPTLGAIPAILFAFASDPAKVLWVIPITMFIQFIENHFLAPQIMKRVVNVNPIVTILSITAFGYLLGFAGLLMAIPLAAIFQVILDRMVLKPAQEEIKEPVGRDSLSTLHYHTQEYVQDIRKLIRTKDVNTPDEDNDDVEDALESIASELDDLLTQSLPPEEEISL